MVLESVVLAWLRLASENNFSGAGFRDRPTKESWVGTRAFTCRRDGALAGPNPAEQTYQNALVSIAMN